MSVLAEAPPAKNRMNGCGRTCTSLRSKTCMCLVSHQEEEAGFFFLSPSKGDRNWGKREQMDGRDEETSMSGKLWPESGSLDCVFIVL